MTYLNIAHYISCTEAEGPGRRFVLWVQGCKKHCKGCCNPHMRPLAVKRILSCKQVLDKILLAKDEYAIEGITFLGGEPFLQAEGLSYLASECRKNGLTVMTFTGYALSSLRKKPFPFTEELISCSDVLVDGPYIKSQPEELRNWLGSKNQKVHFLSTAYKPGIEYAEEFSDSIELRFDQQGVLQLNGSPVAIR